MSEYTPDEEQVREQYTQEQPPQIGSVAEKRALDRFIAHIKAEAWDEAIAEAMEQGTIQVPPNPYREEAGL